MRAIDLFAGIGGVRLGFERAFPELETVFVSEIDPSAQKTYRANFSEPAVIHGDIRTIPEREIPLFDICLAGFPCQAFSQAGHRRGFSDDYKGGTRGTLFFEVIRICAHHRPKVVFCENVKGLAGHDKGNTFKVITGALEEIGYTAYSQILNSADFGVPQSRDRVYIVAIRNDLDDGGFAFPVPDMCRRKPSLKEILEDAPIPPNFYLSETYVASIKAHKARHLEEGHGFGYVIRDTDGLSGTLVCGGSGREGNLIIDSRPHDKTFIGRRKSAVNSEDIRALTPREWARLQGFPDSFMLPVSNTQLYKQLGNSVTVSVIEAIAREVSKVV